MSYFGHIMRTEDDRLEKPKKIGMSRGKRKGVICMDEIKDTTKCAVGEWSEVTLMKIG